MSEDRHSFFMTVAILDVIMRTDIAPVLKNQVNKLFRHRVPRQNERGFWDETDIYRSRS